jgi:glycosyltransferase involved in cell wall biosynthesis
MMKQPIASGCAEKDIDSSSARLQVVIPSYSRSHQLAICLGALAEQSFQSFEVICVVRDSDCETRRALHRFRNTTLKVREVIVFEAGLAVALKAGFRAASAEFITFTDDDSEAPTHWIQTIVEHFDLHLECGAVGGPDRIQVPEPRLRSPKPARSVGVYSWLGGYYATHHHPILEPYLQCLVLKGVNMSFRRDLLRGAEIGSGLIGVSCTVGTEQGLCAEVIRRGHQVHFLRDAWVLHHCAPRQQSDNRLDLRSDFAVCTSYNRAYVLCRYQPLMLSIVVLLRSGVIGSKYAPGLLRCITRGKDATAILALFAATMRGALAGLAARFLGPQAASQGRSE